MKNITVSVDEETHRLSRIQAAELGTSVSALVRGYLKTLVREQDFEANEQGAETKSEQRCRLLNEVFEDICATQASDNLPHTTAIRSLIDICIKDKGHWLPGF